MEYYVAFKENEEDSYVLMWNLFQDTLCLNKEHINAYILLPFAVKKRGGVIMCAYL